jgi:phage-related baseplate assembly protein
MARFSADGLDLSRFPPPLAIRGIDYESIFAERKTRLLELLTEAGIPFDVDRLEVDPAIIVEEADAYRELLTLARINDAVRSVMVAFAVGSDLDHLAAFYGVERAAGENDVSFRRDVLIAPEAFGSAGAHGAYVFHARRAAPLRIANVDVWSPEAGRVEVAVQSSEGDGQSSADLLAIVRDRLYRKDVKPLTDMVNVRSIVNVPYTIKADGYILPGPDPQMVRTEALRSLQAMALYRKTPARDVPRSAVFAAASVGPMDKVIVHSPAQDIARGNGEVGVCTAIDMKVTVYDG